MNEIDITVSGIELDFETAGEIANIIASKIDKNSILLAWLDNRGDSCHPSIDCCDENTPQTAYEESRKDTIKIRVNKIYEFIFRKSETLVVQI